ncbi:hypothetical protein PAMP_005742 [Pampus punctatissimus]
MYDCVSPIYIFQNSGDGDEASEGRMQTVVKQQFIKNKTPLGKVKVATGSTGEKWRKNDRRVASALFVLQSGGSEDCCPQTL